MEDQRLMAEAGHNLPPDMTITAGEVSSDLSGWMSENPVIETEDQARKAKVFIDRGKLAIEDLEAERTGKVKPLNDQVAEINDHYRGPRELLRGVLDELGHRITTFILKEEKARFAIAEAARLKAEDAERAAREAEERERGAYLEASHGVLGVDIGNVTAEADQRFREFERASHQAALAERETHVRVGGGFRRSLSLKTKTSIVVSDPIAAFTEIGLNNEGINDAICTAAKAYKRLSGRWPEGIKIATERKA
jgi:hypothetical protein